MYGFDVLSSQRAMQIREGAWIVREERIDMMAFDLIRAQAKQRQPMPGSEA